ncbi:MAG: hypothetical protein ABWX59_07695 [Microbacteriaceae bacterium]
MTRTKQDRPVGLRMSERLSLALFATLAAAYGVGAASAAGIGLTSTMLGDEVTVSLSASQEVPASAVTGLATLVEGTFDAATVVVSGLDIGSRALLAGGILVIGLMNLAIAATLVALCLSLVRGRPFARSMTRLLATASSILMLGGLIGAGLTVAGQFAVATQLDPDPVDTVFPLAGSADLTPLIVGLGLAAVAAAFELAERLQRDTDGLV